MERSQGKKVTGSEVGEPPETQALRVTSQMYPIRRTGSSRVGLRGSMNGFWKLRYSQTMRKWKSQEMFGLLSICKREGLSFPPLKRRHFGGHSLTPPPQHSQSPPGLQPTNGST